MEDKIKKSTVTVLIRNKGLRNVIYYLLHLLDVYYINFVCLIINLTLIQIEFFSCLMCINLFTIASLINTNINTHKRSP